MELYSKTSRRSANRSSSRRRSVVDFQLFSQVLKKYAQDTSEVPPGGGVNDVNPQELQPGQSLYDAQGKEQKVILAPEGTGEDIVLMPQEQSGATVPQGVSAVDPNALSTEYSLQNPMQARRLQGSGWETPDKYTALTSTDDQMSIGQEEQGLRVGEPGYMEIIDTIRALKDSGFSPVDIVLNVGELYPRDLGERVLAEARRKGII